MKSKFIFFVLISITGVQAQSWKAVEGKIMSQWAKTVNPENAWQEYPRPQFERAQWKNLNGLWDYAILKTNEIQPKRYQGKILVPFSFESPLSGVGKNIKPEDKMWYRKNFELPKNWSEKDVVIHFEAVDYKSDVWVNDIPVDDKGRRIIFFIHGGGWKGGSSKYARGSLRGLVIGDTSKIRIKKCKNDSLENRILYTKNL